MRSLRICSMRCCFEGRPVIRPEELEDADTEESSILEHRDYSRSIQASRDNIKICKRSVTYGVELVMLGLEHQEHIHYAMPMRVMGYDYSAYKKQYDRNARQNDLIFHNMNNIAFFHMMNVILDRSLPGEEAKKKVIEYAREHAVDKTVIMTVAGAANCRIDYNALSGKGDFDMLYLI